MLSDEDLRRLCAEKVMGWRRGGKGDHTKPKHRKSRDYPGTIINDYDAKGEHDYLQQPGTAGYEHRVYLCGCDSYNELPDPLTNEDDCAAVLDKMAADGWSIDLAARYDTNHSWCCEIEHMNRGSGGPNETGYEIIHGITPENRRRAIVLAALKAKGTDPQEEHECAR